MPLFPVNEPIKIDPNSNNNHFLLAFLDGFINHMEGLNHLKSLFRENADGSVTLRIKRAVQSAYFQPENVENSCIYNYNEVSGEDEFRFPHQLITEIKNSNRIVTNCLAVKILERVSSYVTYNSPKVPGEPLLCGVLPSKSDQRKDSVYIGGLANLYAQDNLSIDKLANIQKVLSDLPIYLSMESPQNGLNVKGNGRSIYRVVHISNAGKEDEAIILVNPWTTGKLEPYGSKDLMNNKLSGCFFAPDLATYHFAKWLTKQSERGIERLLVNPVAISLIQDGLKQNPNSGTGLLDRYSSLIKSATLLRYYQLFTAQQREAFHNYVLTAKEPLLDETHILNFALNEPIFADIAKKIINETDIQESTLQSILKSVISNKNDEIYQSLKLKYDLPVPSVLSNNPELYDDLVYLDLKSPPVNGEMWANINKKIHPDAPYFEQRFLEFVIDRAAREKESPKLDFNSAKSYVKNTLIDHFFYPNEPAVLTSAGNIRKLFTQPQPLFTREQGLDASTPQEFSVRAVSYFLRNIYLTDGICFQVRTPFVLSNDECRHLLMTAPTKNLGLQISQIHTLSNYNSKVARDLVLFAINNAQGLYGLSKREVQEEINKIADDSIKQWLAGITASIKSQPSFDWQVIEVKIKDFSASFGPVNLEAIQAIKAKKINDLYQLTFNDEDSNASTLNDLKEKNQLPEGVKKALDLKINQIEQNAASAVLQAATRQLNSISINFKDCKDDKEIVKHEHTSFQKVDDIVNHPLVLDAVKKKGNTSMDFQLFESEKRRVKKSVSEKSDARLDEIQKVSDKANQGKPGLQPQVQEKKIQLNLSQEEQKFNVSLNQLNIDGTNISSSEFISIVDSLRTHLKAIGDILFSNARNENQNMSHGEIINQLKVLVTDLHKQPESKVKDRIIRQFEIAIEVINLTRNKILASGVNEDIIYQKFWIDLVSLTKGESKSNILLSSNQKQFSENAVALGKAMESLPDGPFKQKVTVVQQDLERVAGDVFKADNKLSSNVNSAPNKLIGQLDNLAEVPRPSGWENIVQYLRTMINTLVASISALKNSILPNNNIGLFRTNSKDWDEVKVAADNLAEPAAAKNCKIQ